MLQSTLKLLFLLTITTWCFAISVSVSISDPISVYDALAAHGLPIGLLPKGISNFTIKQNGEFDAHLDEPCRSKLGNQFEYKKDISGQLSYGRMGNLTGMESLELFVWVEVNEIRVDIPNSGRIHFDLDKGVHKELSLSLFETPADCVAITTQSAVDYNRVLVAEKVGRLLEYRHFDSKTSRKDVM